MGYRYIVRCNDCAECFPDGPHVSEIFATYKEAIDAAVNYPIGSIWDYEIEEVKDEGVKT